MHFSTIVTLALSVFSARVIAENCQQGWKYCGHDLLVNGDYHNNIQQALVNAKLPYDDRHMLYTLFECGENGLLVGKATACSSACVSLGKGSGKNDYCYEA
ncbi:hypothetical protein BCIN_12g01600 [Botrytis cinerea B05.10]|uniref:Uncharacterized protein n=2 Tax=Botryotinia fuckeliana TaxID=40559 RepID=A0A384JZ74_BOTFB|nr:hypothetical protein BCIN_12g01600 [Botrytis cinerea B05.10]ATZ55577.1 hypothetical protein BCIN_12g01600 [Botrytis cinerea B05.10]CCD53809.1 hypothetical protein BofuT4_P133630.1 [Botrytis cinerea T4]